MQKQTHALNKAADPGHDHDNGLLVNQIRDLQLELHRVKAEMKKMERKHSAEMRIRDRKEVFFFVLVASCCIIFGCVALLTRGFI
jgi:dynactin complex subunit